MLKMKFKYMNFSKGFCLYVWCSIAATTLMGASLRRFHSTKRKFVKARGKVIAAAAAPVAIAPVEEVKE